MTKKATQKTKQNKTEVKSKTKKSTKQKKLIEQDNEQNSLSQSEKSQQKDQKKQQKRNKIKKNKKDKKNTKVDKSLSQESSEHLNIDLQEFEFDEFKSNLQNLQEYLQTKEENKMRLLQQLDKVIKVQTQNLDIEQIQRNLVKNIAVGFKDVFDEVFENFSSSFTQMANKIEDNLMEREHKKRMSSKIAQRKKKISKKKSEQQKNEQGSRKSEQEGDLQKQQLNTNFQDEREDEKLQTKSQDQNQENLNQISQKSVQNEEETIRRINEEDEKSGALNTNLEQENQQEQDFQIQDVNNSEQSSRQNLTAGLRQNLQEKDNTQEEKQNNDELNMQKFNDENTIQEQKDQENLKEIQIVEETTVKDIDNNTQQIETTKIITEIYEPQIIEEQKLETDHKIEDLNVKEVKQEEKKPQEQQNDQNKQIQFDAFSLQLNQQFQFIDMSQQLKDKIVYTPKEIKYFEHIWKHCLKVNGLKDSNILQSSIAASVLSKSNLPREMLQKIWQYSSQYPDKITKKDFYFALKLIAIKQNDMPINEQNIISTSFIPKLDIQFQPQKSLSFSESVDSRRSLELDMYNLNQKTLMRIENYIDNRCKTVQKGVLTKNESHDLFQSAAGLGNNEQQHLWNLCDVEQKGYLGRGQFILALFFISQHKKGIQIPKTIPSNLKEFLKNYQQKEKTSVKKNISKSKEKKIYQKKFESSMNLLLKKILDQESVIQEQMSKQQGLTMNEEKEVENLQKCLEESIQLNRQIEEQNQILKNLLEFIQIQMFDKQKEVDDVVNSQHVILEQFYIISQKVLHKKKDYKQFRSKLLDYLEQNMKNIQHQNSIEDTMNRVFDKNIQTEKELITQPSFEPNDENPFNDFFDQVEEQNIQQEKIEETQNQIKQKQQQMNKQNNEQEDQQQKDDNDKLDACSHIAKKDYGVKKVGDGNEQPQKNDLKEASTKTLEDKESVKLKDEMIPEDFQEYNKEDTKKSVKSDDEFQVHKQDFQKKDDEFFINHEIRKSKNALRKSKES